MENNSSREPKAMRQANTCVQPTLLLPAAADNWLYKIVLALSGAALLTLSAKIQVPFYPVPMTM